MRLPGTWNPGGHNDLPSIELLLHQRDRRAARNEEQAAQAANGKPNTDIVKSRATFGISNQHAIDNRQFPNHKAKKVLADATAETNPCFNEFQDKALIDLKYKGKTWREIATELGKDQVQIKTRWGQIKPANFDAKMAEEKKQAELGKAGTTKKTGGDNERNEGSRGKQGKNGNGRKGDGGVEDGIMEPDANWTQDEVNLISCLSRLEN
jgi:hypothetical protein